MCSSDLFDVLVGINLLREGIDLPEVTLVAILDADKEGLFRSARSLIQMIGRAARNANGKVILYADTITDSMKTAIDETERRRAIQIAYNEAHGIIPQTIVKPVAQSIAIGTEEKGKKSRRGRSSQSAVEVLPVEKNGSMKKEDRIAALTEEMKKAAKELRFEEAAYLRDRIRELEATK